MPENDVNPPPPTLFERLVRYVAAAFQKLSDLTLNHAVGTLAWGLFIIAASVILTQTFPATSAQPSFKAMLALWGIATGLPLIISYIALSDEAAWKESRSVRWIAWSNKLGSLYVGAFLAEAMLVLIVLVVEGFSQITFGQAFTAPSQIAFFVWLLAGVFVSLISLAAIPPSKIITRLDTNRLFLLSTRKRWAFYFNTVLWGLGFPCVVFPAVLILWQQLSAITIGNGWLGLGIVIAGLLYLAREFGKSPPKKQAIRTLVDNTSAQSLEISLINSAHELIDGRNIRHISLLISGFGNSLPVSIDDDTLQGWQDTWSTQSQNKATAIKFGTLLGNIIFPPQLRPAIVAKLLKTTEHGRRFRIIIQADDTLNAIPWECALLHTGPGEPTHDELLHQLEYVDLIRRSPHKTSLSISAVSNEVNDGIIFAYATPAHAKMLPEIKNEMAFLKSLAANSGLRKSFFYEGISTSALSHLPCADIFHFSGHGMYEQRINQAGRGVILLEGTDGGTAALDASELGIYLRAAGVTKAVLAACDTAQQHHHQLWGSIATGLMACGLSQVVAMQYPIKDSTASTFTKIFYAQIFDGKSLEVAVNHARRAIIEQNNDYVGASAPVIFLASHYLDRVRLQP